MADIRRDYERAESFASAEMGQLVFNEEVKPHWLHGAARFWYRREACDSIQFILVDAEKGSRDRAGRQPRPPHGQDLVERTLDGRTVSRYTASEEAQEWEIAPAPKSVGEKLR